MFVLKFTKLNTNWKWKYFGNGENFIKVTSCPFSFPSLLAFEMNFSQSAKPNQPNCECK